MVTYIRVREDYDSYIAQHDEYSTECRCSECGGYLGNKDYTHKTSHIGDFDENAKYCQFCGKPLYPEEDCAEEIIPFNCTYCKHNYGIPDDFDFPTLHNSVLLQSYIYLCDLGFDRDANEETAELCKKHFEHTWPTE